MNSPLVSPTESWQGIFPFNMFLFTMILLDSHSIHFRLASNRLLDKTFGLWCLITLGLLSLSCSCNALTIQNIL